MDSNKFKNKKACACMYNISANLPAVSLKESSLPAAPLTQRVAEQPISQLPSKLSTSQNSKSQSN